MLSKLLAAIAVAALSCGPALAAVQTLEPMDNGQVSFVMPSGNIGCLYTPEGGTEVYVPADGGPELICERIEPSYVTVVLSDVDEASVIEDPAEQGCCGADNVFEYGNTIELDGFECESTESGLVCENDEGFGFSMARAGIELFDPDPEDLAEGDAGEDADEDDSE
jgi:hypothetical protein